MVMEYLEGSDLLAHLAAHGPLPVVQMVGYVLQACEALAEAHALGIVHRDVKPANLFLANRPDRPPVVKVLDFGISKSTFVADQAVLTKTSSVLGSPLYMSPEQMQSSKTANVRSDIWSLGVVMFELLTGKLPFNGDTMPEFVIAVVQREAPTLRSLRPELPEELEAVVGRCLAKDPSARFQNVGELAAALAPFGPARGDVSVERIAEVLDRGSRPSLREVAPGPTTRIEGAASSAPTLAGPPPTSWPGGGVGLATTEGALSRGAPAAARGSTRVRAGLAVGAVVLVGAFAAWRGSAPPPASAAVPAPHVEAQPPPSPGPVAAAEPSPSASSPEPPPAASVSAHAEPPPPSRAAPPKPATAPVRPATAAPALPKVNCTPPYIIDSAGHHQYKPECN
jgi:serine/threonine-protein kinase